MPDNARAGQGVLRLNHLFGETYG